MDSDPEPIRGSMMSMRSPIPYAHDLLLVRSTTIEEACMAEPTWVRPVLEKYPWVVARRATSTKDRIAVGVRGQERRQRWGGFMRKDQIAKVITPWRLRSALANRMRLGLPAIQSLRFLEIELASLSNDWGPGGSVGYELASHAPVVTRESDLDLVISAPVRLNRDFAQQLWKKMALAPAKVDVRIETPGCGFSLEEYVSSEKLLVRTSTGPRLTTDPWNQRAGGNE
jgi:phosphoribosyl-dephospho-CoA transferase